MTQPGPKAKYLDEIECGVIWRDELQAAVVDEFQRLYDDLVKPKKKSWLFKSKEPAARGIYIYGSVGRGKTHLMDLFFDTLPDHVGKRRQHFHEFMLWLHLQLRNQGDAKDPLDKICKKLASTTQILCLDEFLVNDIANAMLLAGVLQAFNQHGIAMVTTSNVKPDDLYLDGLQRAKFLTAIDWINHNMQVLHLDGTQDYRQQEEQQHEHWYYPINDSSQMHLNECFIKLSNHATSRYDDWQINDRKLSVIKHAYKTLWCDFSALCDTPRNADDYIQIAAKIDHLIVANIPQMNSNQDNAARRFITLIDVMYEHGVKIIAEGACHYKIIYQGKKMAFEFERAASRLAELLVSE
ncbi:cell division protein ZapE [Marinicella sp. S1101]|uniref:cell division protein ZapE n=1 Tax=Marinicella marina TaxID=2996016 RepID=UPI002260FCF8|nr:cell division protein ZapE [Marinicella marina]MCX7554941.1 cell division protein ZapE [Marinicella marina]MDJ1141551.1 cell division protein ZapE [Marinicella marina]